MPTLSSSGIPSRYGSRILGGVVTGYLDAAIAGYYVKNHALGYSVELCVGVLSGICEVKKLLVLVLLEEVCIRSDLDLSLEAAGWYPEKLFLPGTRVENSSLVLR